MCHFVPLLCKTFEPNETIEKLVHLSPSDSVQSQNNPKDGLALHPVKSVAASQQQVPLFLTQPEYLEQVPEKIESASVMNTHQAITDLFINVL